MTLSCGFCQYPALGGLKLLFTDWIRMLRAKGFAFQRQETKGTLSPASFPPATAVVAELSTPSPPHPSRLSQSASGFPLAVCFTYGNVNVSVLLSQIIPPSLSSRCVQKSVLYVCVSFAALQRGPSHHVYFLKGEKVIYRWTKPTHRKVEKP